MALRILIVDASRRATADLGAVLLAHGHRVSVARDLSGGYAELNVGAFDLLIVDVDLPRRQSTLPRTLGFLAAARLVEPSASAILLTGDTAALPPDLAPLGVVGILSKPTEFGALRKFLDEAERRTRAARAAEEAAPGPEPEGTGTVHGNGGSVHGSPDLHGDRHVNGSDPGDRREPRPDGGGQAS